jgi:hypothetical protein
MMFALPIVMTIVVVVGSLFFVFRMLAGLGQAEKNRQRLLQVGVPAHARVLGVQMGGMTVSVGVNRQLQLVIGLEVHRPGAAPYNAQLTTLVSELQIPQVQPGAWLAVRIDPANPSDMAIEALGVGPPGAAPAAAAAMAGAPGAMPGPPQGMVGAQLGTPVAPMGGFRLPMGAKIGLGVGVIGALVGIGAAVNALVLTNDVLGGSTGSGSTGSASGSTGSTSDVCKKAAQCCKKVSGTASAACDNWTRAGMMDVACQEALKGYRQAGHCK